jgi:IS605 OrfB family transposase
MQLTLQTQLFPDAAQAEMLKETLRAFNSACSWLAEKAFALKSANKIALQQMHYAEIRANFGLSAQMTVRAIAQSCEAYKRDKTICPQFREFASMPFDERMMSFKGIDKVSLLTLQGRVIVPLVMGKYQADRFSNAKGQCDLVYREHDGKWFLLVTAEFPDGEEIELTDFIGIDLGINQLVTTSDGNSETGSEIDTVQKKYAKLRQILQHKAAKQTRSRKRPRSIHRFLKRISKRVRHFKRHSNHVISKKIVQNAKDTNRNIAIEDLKGIRGRCEARFRRFERARFSGWSFSELRQYIEYKAKLAGVSVLAIDPRNTSRRCNKCGHCGKENRKSQAEFVCVECNHSENADINAAKNIRSTAISNYAARVEKQCVQSTW